ncbi:MAG: hypothetical protein V3T21_01845 [Candidatus Margulisiibacteriota bacterium]
MFDKYRSILLLAVCALFLGVYLSGGNVIGGAKQWDFRAHYFSVKAYEAGLNPYNNKDVNSVNDSRHFIYPQLTYPYHPVTFGFFRLFTKFEFPDALKIYFACNLLLLLVLIILWKDYFLKEKILILFFAVLWLFSFNNPIIIALRAANPAIFEAALVWVALAFLINNHSLPFLLLLAILSFFKGTPLILSPLVFLIPKDKKKIFFQIAAVLLLFGILFIWPYFSNPLLFNSYWNYASTVKETGIINPCSYAFIMDLAKWVGLGKSWAMINSTYALWGILILTVYIFIVRKLNWNKHKILIVFFTLLTYAIIAPRFKDYAYIQLLPISYFLITRNLGLIAVNLFGILTSRINLPYFIKHYHPFFAAVIGWGYLGFCLLRSKKL